MSDRQNHPQTTRLYPDWDRPQPCAEQPAGRPVLRWTILTILCIGVGVTLALVGLSMWGG